MKTAFAFVLMFAVLLGLSHAASEPVSCQYPPPNYGHMYTPLQEGYEHNARVTVGEPPMKVYVCYNGQWFD